jgi:GNAT superfamily N-acetyltransferase
VNEIIRAGEADLDVLSAVIAEAFCDLPPSRWLIADQAARRDLFPAYFRIFAEHALAHGEAWTTAGRTAVALWLPAGDRPPPAPEGYAGRLRAVTAPWTRRFIEFDAALERCHPAGTPHHHLAILAVQPGRQGQGTGTALLRSHHQVLDQAGLPAYLEASSPQNRRLYLRHGYHDVWPRINLPQGPPMYPMWREPQPVPQTGDN